MFVIKHSNRAYFHNKGRIILYESQQEANEFLNMFIQYSINRLMHENRVDEARQAPLIIISNCQITPQDFNISDIKCGVVYAKDLFKGV